MKIQTAESYKGSAKTYIKEFILPQLPNVYTCVYFSTSLEKYLANDTNLRIVRKFDTYNKRGSKYIYDNTLFTVSDNEAALWVYMESLRGIAFFDYKLAIKQERFPIAFALKGEEKECELVYTNIGKKKRENNFSKLGWKHCHIFQCSPNSKSINDLTLNQRMRRLLNPMNHFPFPSPRKFEMPYDYGEDPKFISLLISILLEDYYTTENLRDEFREFALNSGVPADSIQYECEDFDIIIGDNKQTELQTNSKTNDVMIDKKFNHECIGFKIQKSWIGQGKLIKCTFNRGRDKGKSFIYDHDAVYNSAKEHLNNLPSFHNDGFNYSSTNIPRYVQNKHVIEL